MALILPRSYHGLEAVEANRIRWMPPERAASQDIRPLRIGILNIMPLGEQYEFNLLHPLGLSLIQIQPIWLRLRSHAYRTWSRQHLDELYVGWEAAMAQAPLDGLIITGAPVEHLSYEDVKYWDEICELMNVARAHIPSTLGLCWAGFAMAFRAGVEKRSLPNKLFGVYHLHNLDRAHPVMGSHDDRFPCPQSRHASLDDQAMEQAEAEGRLRLLAYGDKVGYSIFETPDQRQIVHLGHPEYNAGRLIMEAERDQTDPLVAPPEHFDLSQPLNLWRSHRNLFFGNWIHHIYSQISMPHARTAPASPLTEKEAIAAAER